MAYTSTNCCEAPESKIMREKNREIEILKEVIVEQAKALTDNKRMYLEVIDRNTELRDARDNLRRESNEMFEKVYKIKELLRFAKDAYENAKSQRQREVSKIRVDALQEAIDILEGDEEECQRKKD